MANTAADEFAYLTNEWISLPNLSVRKDKIVAWAEFDKFGTISIVLENGVELTTKAIDRKGLENLVYGVGDKVNGTVIRWKGEDNGQ